MNNESVSELQAFQDFIVEMVNHGGAAATPEAVLDEWRMLHPSDGDLWAVKEALVDMSAGDAGVSLEEYQQQFRQKHNLPQ